MRSSEILYYDDYNPVRQYFSKLYSKIGQNSILLSLSLFPSLLRSLNCFSKHGLKIFCWLITLSSLNVQNVFASNGCGEDELIYMSQRKIQVGYFFSKYSFGNDNLLIYSYILLYKSSSKNEILRPMLKFDLHMRNGFLGWHWIQKNEPGGIFNFKHNKYRFISLSGSGAFHGIYS